MGRKDQGVLGVDLHGSEVRVVHVRFRGNKAIVVGAQSAAMPSDAMRGDRIANSGSASLALKRLIDGMHVGDARVNVGIPGGTSLRNLIVPKVPEGELPMVVEAELEHQGGTVRGGVYAYLKLWSDPEHKDAADSVVVLSVGDEITSSLRNVIERAHLEIDSLEPSQFGMYRALMLAIPANTTTAALMVGPSSTEIALVKDGQLVAYRNIATGSQALLGSSANPFTDDQAATGLGNIGLTHLEGLGTELYRTLDFFAREHPSFAAIQKLYMAVDTPSLAGLGVGLTERVGLPVEMVGLPASEGPAGPKVEGPDALGFAAAYGLAMRDAPASVVRVPRIDLFSKERSTAKQVETKRNFAGSIVLSLVAAGLGALGYFLYSKQIADVEASTRGELSRAAQIRGETDDLLKERARWAQQYKALRREGVPLTAISDYVVEGLEQGVGVGTISVGSDLRVVISGEAIAEQPMIKTVQRLQSSPILPGLIIDSFNRAKDSSGITFQLSARTVPMSSIKLPDESKGTQ